MGNYELRKALDNLPDGVSIIDSDMRIEWVNKILHDMGFHADGVKGHKCYFIYKNKSNVCKHCPAVKAFLTKRAIRIEERGADGKRYEVTAIPISDESGAEKVMEIVREVKKGKPFAASITSSNGINVFVVDSNGKLVAMSKDAEQLTGYTEKEAAGTNFSRVVRRADVRQFNDTLRQILRGSHFPSFETTFRAKSGKEVPVQVSCSPFHSEGALLGVELIARDITQVKEAHSRIKESEEMYRALIRTSPDSVAVSDLKGNITDVSEQTLRLHGFASADEVIGKNALCLIAEEDRARAMQNLKKTLDEGEVRNVEYSLVRKDGSTFRGMLSASLIKDASGKPKAFIATVRECSPARQASKKKTKNK